MGRINKKEAVAALHREQIMQAAEELFSAKGYDKTTIEDISKASEYSRRTIYAYYESKDDILYHIIEKGLLALKKEIQKALILNENYISKYNAICNAMRNYHTNCPHSLENVDKAKAQNLNTENLSNRVMQILILGREINDLLAGFITTGKELGILRQDIIPMITVYILWSNISSLITLAKNKMYFISKEFSISENEFLEYGFKQILNSILEVKK